MAKRHPKERPSESFPASVLNRPFESDAAFGLAEARHDILRQRAEGGLPDDPPEMPVKNVTPYRNLSRGR